MMSVSISVVIPTCDRPDSLRKTVSSVLKQSCQPGEIIIVDNGRQPVEKVFLPASESLRLIRALPRFGVSQARNLGAITACSDYVAFLDDDDTWDPFYLEAVSQTVNRTRADIVLGRLRSMDNNNPLRNKQADFVDRNDLLRKILRRNPGAVGSNTSVAKTAFLKTSGYDPWLTTGQDKALVLDMLLSQSSVARADDAWVNFRENFAGERQTELKKRIEGKLRFTRKYWRYMDAGSRLFNSAQLCRLWLRYLFGAKY